MTTDDPQAHPIAESPIWQRFNAVVDQHFETVCWTRQDGTPVLISLVDLASGQALTLQPLVGFDYSAYMVLVAAEDDGRLSARGPFPGAEVANDIAMQMASADAGVVATFPAALHPPGQPCLPERMWMKLTELGAARMWAPAPVEAAAPVVLVLVDHTAKRMALVGPFDTVHDANWRCEPPLGPSVEQIVLALDERSR